MRYLHFISAPRWYVSWFLIWPVFRITDFDQEKEPDAYYAAYDSAKEKHLSELLQRINVDALVSLASSLRNGIGCIIPAQDDGLKGKLNIEKVSCQMGGQNCHLDVVFEDGVVWLARIRLDDPLHPPKPTQSYIVLSEVSTLRYLETVDIPSPKVYYIASESCENPVGVTFVLMQKMHGNPLNWELAASSHRSKILEQLADNFLELEKHPFQQAGSLVALGSSGPSIGGYAQVALFHTPETPLGSSALWILLQMQCCRSR